MKPDATVKQSSPPQDWGARSIVQADWMLMAAMRDVDNAFFDISGEETGIVQGLVQGVTMPWK